MKLPVRIPGLRALLAFLTAALLVAAPPLLAQEAAAPRPTVDLPGSPETGEAAPTTLEAAGSQDGKKDDSLKTEAPKSAWLDNPPTRIFPRPGFFTVPPKGPGYYSFLDVIQDNFREGPPKAPYGTFALMPPSMFDTDFKYLDNPKNTQYDLFDPLHRIHLGDDWLFSTGGQMWWRHMHEVNSRLSGKDNTYELFRVRPWVDLWYRNDVRVFVEFISAQTFNQDLKPAGIDEKWNAVALADFLAAADVGHRDRLAASGVVGDGEHHQRDALGADAFDGFFQFL